MYQRIVDLITLRRLAYVYLSTIHLWLDSVKAGVFAKIGMMIVKHIAVIQEELKPT